MRPISLQIEGLRSFKTDPPTVIDFADRDQIAIIGDTGAGKSSILEAMTYALYGQVSFSSHANQELMNDECEYLRVVFSFWAANYQWHATRTLQRKKSGETGGGTARLEKTGDSEQALQTVEGVKEVNKHVTSLLGLDVNAFLRTIVLPQGRFARLLTEDEPRNRANILRQIWQTGDIEQAAQQVKNAIKELELITTRIDGASAQHPEDPGSYLTGLERTEAEAGHRVRKARQTENDAIRMLEKVTEQLRRHALGKTAIETARAADRSGLDARGSGITERSEALNSELEAVKAQRKAVQEQVNRSEKTSQEDVDRADRSVQVIQNLIERQAEASAAETDLRTATNNREAARTAQDEAEQASENAGKELETLERATTDRETAARDAEQARTRAESAWTDYRQTLLEPLGRAEAEREALLLEHKTLKKRLEQENVRVQEDKDRLSATGTELQAAVRQNQAAAASAHSEPGQPCPICDRALPGGWKRPDTGDVLAIQERETTERARLNQAEQTAAGATVKLSVNTETGKKNRDHLADLRKRAQEAESRLRKLLAVEDLSAVHDVQRALKRLETAQSDALALAEESRTAVQPHRQAMVATASRMATAVNDGRHAEGLVRSGTERLKRTTENTRLAARAVLDGGGAWPLSTEELKDWSTRGNKAQAQLEQALDKASKLAATVRKTAAQHVRWTAALLTHGVKAQTIDQQIRREVTEPTDRLHQDIASRTGDIRRVLNELRTGPIQEPAQYDAARPIQACLKELTTLETDLEQTGQGAQAEAVSQGRQLRQALSDLLQKQGLQVNPKDSEQVRTELRTRTEEAAGAQSFTARQIEAFKKMAPMLAELRKTGEHAQNQRNRLQEIDAGLKAGAFPKWLTLRRSTDLLRHASKNLEDMTHHRYAFRDPRDTEEQWKILDRQTGATRSPASLSGGEQFIASLSLALGMVETMGQRGGRLESFFLDEGFGSLDESALETALDALDQASTPEHLVGVITHVRRIAERVPHVLSVERSPSSGSRTRWLSREECEQTQQ